MDSSSNALFIVKKNMLAITFRSELMWNKFHCQRIKFYAFYSPTLTTSLVAFVGEKPLESHQRAWNVENSSDSLMLFKLHHQILRIRVNSLLDSEQFCLSGFSFQAVWFSLCISGRSWSLKKVHQWCLKESAAIQQTKVFNLSSRNSRTHPDSLFPVKIIFRLSSHK